MVDKQRLSALPMTSLDWKVENDLLYKNLIYIVANIMFVCGQLNILVIRVGYFVD